MNWENFFDHRVLRIKREQEKWCKPQERPSAFLLSKGMCINVTTWLHGNNGSWFFIATVHLRYEEPIDTKVVIDQTCYSIGNITVLLWVILPDPGFCPMNLLCLLICRFPHLCLFWSAFLKLYRCHLHGLSNSRTVKELIKGLSPAWWHFTLWKEMLL